jgi:hypothetical protein
LHLLQRQRCSPVGLRPFFYQIVIIAKWTNYQVIMFHIFFFCKDNTFSTILRHYRFALCAFANSAVAWQGTGTSSDP